MNIFKTFGTMALVLFAIKFGWAIMLTVFKVAVTAVATIAVVYMLAS